MAYKIYQGLNAIFELTGPFAKLMTRERKAIVLASLREGGEFFKAKYIPLRFTDYAYRLGYRVTVDWKKFKKRVLNTKRAQPFIGPTPAGGGQFPSLISGMPDVRNAEKMAVAMQRGCRVDVSGTSRGGNIKIRTPYGHPILPVMAKAFTNVTEAENQAVAQAVAAAFRDFLKYAQPTSKRAKRLTIAGAQDKWVPRGHKDRHTTRANDSGVTHRA